MTNCDSCGELTRHARVFEQPYWVCCPRCAASYSKRTGQRDTDTARNLALEEARGRVRDVQEAREVGAMNGLDIATVDALIGMGVYLRKGAKGNGRT
jgi:hypothetical protein